MENSTKTGKKLNTLLANYQIYYQNLRGLHWNIQGKHFFELHAKFEELYNDTAVRIDDIAERILTIEETPLHTFEDYLKSAEIKPCKNVHDGEKAVKVIVENLSYIIKEQKKAERLAEENGDGATADLLAAFNEAQEKTLWMYKAWLK